jgi:type II secretory pathway pseudopilin PulG
MNARLRRQGGYTLVETIVGITVGAVVMAAIFPVFLLLYRVETTWGDAKQARATGLLAEDTLLRDLRAYEVVSLSPLVLSSPGDHSYSIDYSVDDSGRLIRRIDKDDASRVVVAHGIKDITIYCFGNPAQVRLVITTISIAGTGVSLEPDLVITPRNRQACPL